MSERKTVSVSDHCPYLERDHSIDATYVKAQGVGQSYEGATLIEFLCDKQTQCGKQNHECPLHKVALNRKYW